MAFSEIAVVAFDRISPFHLSVPCIIFGEQHPGVPKHRLTVCTFETGPLDTSAGFQLAVSHGLAELETAQTVIVPSWRNPEEKPPIVLIDAITRAHKRGARIVGLCLGAYVLAHAGLLDGRRATTHWSCAADFQKRFPSVALDSDVLYVEDENIVTSAGTAAGIDCCLHLVQQQYGAEIANRIARRLVVPAHRQGRQAQYIEQPIAVRDNGCRLTLLLDSVKRTLNQVHTLDSLATKAGMSRRTFSRHFRQTTGVTLGEWLSAERLLLAQRMLEQSQASIERIAADVGFASATAMRQQFRRALGMSPAAWR